MKKKNKKEYTKEAIEERLRFLLDDCLEAGGQGSSIKGLSYDPEKGECTIRMSVHIVKEDDYVGFEGY